MQHSFQVDLRGMIDLLSEHLYGGPEVFVRELLQNGVDAVRARAAHEAFDGVLSFTLAGDHPTLVFQDNGVGLTEQEVHTFLATIGRSSKRGSSDFIGQFGIGLLACFLVTDHIELLTRSAKGGPGVRWTGHADGRYELSPSDEDVPVGTRVILRAKAGREEFFDPERLRHWAEHYGELLPYRIEVHAGQATWVVNRAGAPWDIPGEHARREALTAFGTGVLGTEPFDVVPIDVSAGEVRGAAFVLPWSPTLAARGQHRVYLRSMLLSEDNANLVPEWAFFVKCVLDTRALRPNAARDDLQPDDALRDAREMIGRQLQAYLEDLARHHPARLRSLVQLHFLSIKSLALENDEFFRLFAPWLPFETSLGRRTLAELTASAEPLQYVSDLNLFRQVAQIAGASGRAVVHAVYTHDAALLEKYAQLNPGVALERIDASNLGGRLGLPGPDALAEAAAFLGAAGAVLEEFACRPRLSVFQPAELAVLFVPHGGTSGRNLRLTREQLSGVWGELLDDLDEADGVSGELYFNHANALVRRALKLQRPAALERVVGTLYVQALLLGHHPLGERELSLLNQGLYDFVAGSLEQAERTLN